MYCLLRCLIFFLVLYRLFTDNHLKSVLVWSFSGTPISHQIETLHWVCLGLQYTDFFLSIPRNTGFSGGYKSLLFLFHRSYMMHLISVKLYDIRHLLYKIWSIKNSTFYNQRWIISLPSSLWEKLVRYLENLWSIWLARPSHMFPNPSHHPFKKNFYNRDSKCGSFPHLFSIPEPYLRGNTNSISIIKYSWCSHSNLYCLFYCSIDWILGTHLAQKTNQIWINNLVDDSMITKVTNKYDHKYIPVSMIITIYLYQWNK